MTVDTTDSTPKPISISLIRTLGYVMLAFAFLDLIAILVPPSFKDAAWEFQTLGEMVERVPVPLIGFAFVFYGENLLRQKWEALVLKFLSWIPLFLSLLTLLFIGLGLSATLRLNNTATLQVDGARSKSLSQIQERKEQLSKATDQDLAQLIDRLKQAGQKPPVQTPEEFRQQFNQTASEAENNLKKQSEVALLTQRKTLLKQSIKWNLAAVLTVFIYFFLWRSSSWARGKKRKKKSKW